MYIERVPNRNSPPTLLLRESYREDGKVRKRTLANLSSWPSELVEQFEQVLKGGRTVERLEATFEVVRSLPHGHVVAALGTLKRLHLDQVIGQRHSLNRQLVIAMIVARILAPSSKLATLRQLQETTATHTLASELSLPPLTPKSLYQAMDWLLKRQPKIEQKLARTYLKTGSVVLIDLSSSYFEGEQCPLAKRGYSRDGKRGTLQVVFGLICNAQGCPVGVDVFAGNTSDPSTLAAHLKKLKERFQLQQGVLVGDRGLLPDKHICQQLKASEGWDWITALKTVQIRKLLDNEAFSLEVVHQKQWCEFQAAEYEGERLIACYNRALATKRAVTRQQLLVATEAQLEQILKATQRSHNPLQGEAAIALRIGKAINRFKVAKHFEVTISGQGFSYHRKADALAQEAQLDGLYVVRTSLKAQALSASEVVTAYKNLSQVEQAFRCFKAFDLQVRPIFHRLEQRVKAHICLCFLAYHLEWHMRQALATLLFAEDDLQTKAAARTLVVEPAQPSPSTRRKAASKVTPEQLPVQSFRSLLADLATITKMTIHPRQLNLPAFEKVTQPTPTQKQALKLLKVSL